MPQQKPRILAIDDTPANLLTLGAALKNDFDMQIATSGAMGIELAKREPPDLILLDIMMPEMDGFETCQQLKVQPNLKDIPVVFVTALNDVESEVKGLSLGALDYITKPIQVETARQRIRNLLEREQYRKAVEENREKFYALSEAAFEAIFISEHGRCLEQNSTAQAMFGYTAEEAVGKLCSEWIAQEDCEQAIAKVLSGSELPYEARGLRKDGSIFPVILRSKNMHYHGRTVRVTSMRYITARKQSERKLNDSLEQLKTRDHALAQISQGVLITTSDRLISYANEGIQKLTGYSEAEMLGKRCAMLQGKNSDPTTIAQMCAALNAEQPFHGVILNYRKDGTEFWNDLSITPVFDEHGKLSQFVSVQRDITVLKLNEERIQKMALFDALTQLANRRLLSDRLAQAMAASKRSGCHGALIFLDLDNFKPLNDGYGHDVGDLLLVEVATRLKSCTREVDTVARFGGDEFVVLLTELEEDRKLALGHARLIAEKIRATLFEPYLLQVNTKEGELPRVVEYFSGASIGVEIFVDHQPEQDELLRRADAAMYQAKQNGRNQIYMRNE